MNLDLNEIPVEEKLLTKSGAQFKGRVLKDKDGKVELQVERDKGAATLNNGQQVAFIILNNGDKPQMLIQVILDLLTKVLGGFQPDGKATKTMGIPQMRQYARIVEAFKAARLTGQVELEAEDVQYVQRHFAQLSLVPNPDSAPLIVGIDLFLTRAATRTREQKEQTA